MTQMPAVPARTILKLQFRSAKSSTQEFTGPVYVYEYHVSVTWRAYGRDWLNGCSSCLDVIQCFSAVLLLVHGWCRSISG